MTDAAKAERPGGLGRSNHGGPKSSAGVQPAGKGVPERHDGSSRLSDHAQARIGSSLRSLYDSIVQQPVPDRFRDLIERLDAKEPKSP